MSEELCLIHGWGFNSNVMQELLPKLQRHFRTTFLSMPGYEKKDFIKGSVDIDAIADALVPGVPDHCILGGWSLGGMAAIRIAHKLKNRVKALVLIASTPCFVKKPDWPCGVERDLIKNMWVRINEGDTEKALKNFALLVSRGDINSRKVMRKLCSMIPGRLPDDAVLLEGLKILADVDLRDDFQQLNLPIIMLSGENDQLVSAQAGEETKKLCPRLQLFYSASSGHAPFLSQPDMFCHQLVSALAAINKYD